MVRLPLKRSKSMRVKKESMGNSKTNSGLVRYIKRWASLKPDKESWNLRERLKN